MAEILKARHFLISKEESGIRLDRWIKHRWPELNHVMIHKLTRSGQIRVDGARVKNNHLLLDGQNLRMPPLPDRQDRKTEGALPEDDIRARARIAAMTLYEDDWILALNKPSGLAVQGGSKTPQHLDRLLSCLGDGFFRPRLVHRLDRDTSGILLLGKTPHAAAKLAQYFAEREVKKTYLAIVFGVPKADQGLINTPLIKRGRQDFERMMPANPQEPGAETAETLYRCLARKEDVAALLALRPLTGRTHQLRAHCLSLGHPILGDRKYYTSASQALGKNLKLQLHAWRLGFPNPSSGLGHLVLEAPISLELHAGAKQFGFDIKGSLSDPFGDEEGVAMGQKNDNRF